MIIVVVIAVIAIGGTAFAVAGRRRRLRERFGPEYDKVVAEHGSRRRAEVELSRREHRVQGLSLRELSDEDWERYSSEWNRVQERFVEAPSEAVDEAQSLVEAVMRERGYPVGDFEQTIADLSVEHARVLDRFRSAHAISQRAASGQAATEDLRTAMLYYRELFDQLLATEPEPEVAQPEDDAAGDRRSGASAAS